MRGVITDEQQKAIQDFANNIRLNTKKFRVLKPTLSNNVGDIVKLYITKDDGNTVEFEDVRYIEGMFPSKRYYGKEQFDKIYEYIPPTSG